MLYFYISLSVTYGKFTMFQASCKLKEYRRCQLGVQSTGDTHKSSEVIILCNECFNKDHPSCYWSTYEGHPYSSVGQKFCMGYQDISRAVFLSEGS